MPDLQRADAVSEALKCPTCGAFTGGRKGDAHPRAVLIEEDVLNIRKLASQGERREYIADMYGVSKSAVDHIVKRRTWKHI